MKSNKVRKLLVEELRKMPIVEIACKKVGIGRASCYRWRKEDSDFARDMDEAIFEGSLLINDLAESQLISAIREKDMSAVRFWLAHRHPAYREKTKSIKPPKLKERQLTPEENKLIERAIELDYGKRPGKKEIIKISKELAYHIGPNY